MEGHRHSSFLGQKWQAKENIKKAKDGEGGLTQPTDHHGHLAADGATTEHSAQGKAVRTEE